MYYDYTVEIPRIRGKIITKKKGNATYVLFQYSQKYNPEKKYAIPQRTIVGKIHENNHDVMYPNEKFQDYFPEVTLPEELPEAFRSCALKIGSYAVIQKVLQEYKLQSLLSTWFPKDWGLLIDLMAYLIVDEENAGQYYPDFAFGHPLFSEGMRIYSDSKVCRLLQSVTQEQIIGFLNDWNKRRDHRQRIYISYDSTNKNCQAGDIDIIEYGKAKDEKGLPVFNLALAFDKTNRVPLFYEAYPGSITDVSQFEYMVDKVKEYNYKSVGFILDRGYFSKDNIRYMEKNGYAFIIMVKGRKRLVSELITANRHTFETDRDCAIHSYGVYGKTILAKLYEDDETHRYFHLYFSASKQTAERAQLERLIERLGKYLEKHIGKDITLGNMYHEYFDLSYNKKHVLVSYSEKKAIVQKKLEQCGYFCIITSTEMTATQALIHYKGRDISEKLFSADKSFIGSKSNRVQSSESLSTKLFIEFIALIVRNRIYNLLKETMLRLETKPNYMTVPAALRELEKIEMVRRSNGHYRLDHAVTKRQKIILSSFGMDENSIRDIACKIDNLLTNSQSLMTTIDTMGEEANDNGTDEIDIFN
jgi:transposase